MADRKEVKNRLRIKLLQRKKEEMDKKSEMLENPSLEEKVAAIKAKMAEKREALKKISSSMNVPISCDNVISSEIDNDAEVMDLLPKKTEEEQEKAAKEKAKEEFLMCSVRNGKYPSTYEEHFDFVKKTFEYLKATNMVKKPE